MVLRILILLLMVLLSPLLPAWEQTGMASWYGGIFQGRQTANGEIYDTYGYTCAHKTLPFGTILEVENLYNNRKVRVRVNDRGPFVEGRIVDLTYAAAQELDMIQDGTAEVRIVSTSIPRLRFTIQIGVWSDMENALRQRRRLTSAGLNAEAELKNNGMTRIHIPEVPESKVNETTAKLEQLGYTDLFIYQVTD